MTGIDKRNRLDEEVFTYRINKDGKIFIAWHGKQIMILKDAKAKKILAQLEAASDDKAIQLILAKVTGNFKHGNER